MAEVDVTNKRIFCRRSHLDVFCKKGAPKYLAKRTGKHVYRSLFQKTFQVAGLQLYLKRGSCKFFFCDIFNFSEQLFYSTHVNRAFDLIEYLETLRINEDLRIWQKILTSIIDFTENIWDFGVAMKHSENRI